MCSIYEDPYCAQDIEHFYIGTRPLSKEAKGLIKSLTCKDSHIVISTRTDRFKDIDAKEDLLLGVFHKYLKEPTNIVITYIVNSMEKSDDPKDYGWKSVTRKRSFIYKDCIFDGYKDEEESGYIYNNRDIYIKFTPVEFKTEVVDLKDYGFITLG